VKKKVLPRQWIPRLCFPFLERQVLYSEILDSYMLFVVTERARRLVDAAYGLDYYLLKTPEIDFGSQLALDLKRLLLIKLAKEEYHLRDGERHRYVKEKYSEFVLPLEEAEWVGLDLNSACRKQQDLEDNSSSVPLKYIYEKKLLEELSKQDVDELHEEEYSKPQPSVLGEKMFGRALGTMAKKISRRATG
jgi:large subunit ribosomal protein L28